MADSDIGLGGGSGGGGTTTINNTTTAEILPAQTAPPAGLANDDLWNREGLFVEEHIRHLAGSARAYTTYDISTPVVTVNPS